MYIYIYYIHCIYNDPFYFSCFCCCCSCFPGFPDRVSPVSLEGRAELGRPDRNESGCAKELPLEGARRGGHWGDAVGMRAPYISLCRQMEFATAKKHVFFFWGGGRRGLLESFNKNLGWWNITYYISFGESIFYTYVYILNIHTSPKDERIRWIRHPLKGTMTQEENSLPTSIFQEICLCFGVPIKMDPYGPIVDESYWLLEDVGSMKKLTWVPLPHPKT